MSVCSLLGGIVISWTLRCTVWYKFFLWGQFIIGFWQGYVRFLYKFLAQNCHTVRASGRIPPQICGMSCLGVLISEGQLFLPVFWESWELGLVGPNFPSFWFHQKSSSSFLTMHRACVLSLYHHTNTKTAALRCISFWVTSLPHLP